LDKKPQIVLTKKQGRRVSLTYGDELYRLVEGDSLYFDADTPHRLENVHKTLAQVLCVFLEE